MPHDELTPMEARCLHELLKVRGRGQVAAALGISESTVKTHLAAARRKLGASSSFEAARRLAEFDQPRPFRPSPDWPIPFEPMPVPDPDRRVVGPDLDDAVREDRAPFLHGTRAPEPWPVTGLQSRAPVLRPIALVVLIAFVVALLVLAAPPFAERLGWLGGLIYHHR